MLLKTDGSRLDAATQWILSSDFVFDSSIAKYQLPHDPLHQHISCHLSEKETIMNYGVVVAGGVGTRMGADKPKQFLTIGNKPIIVHTVEKFVLCNDLEKIIVLTPSDWIEYTEDILEKNLGDALMKRVAVIEGGATRNETIMNSIDYIEKNFGLDDDTVILTHDAVRPFVTHRIIKDNIEAVLKYGATDTVIPATDTIVEAKDGNVISAIPDRSMMYQGQTPQSFKAKELRDT